jgi:hypothetical protein
MIFKTKRGDGTWYAINIINELSKLKEELV